MRQGHATVAALAGLLLACSACSSTTPTTPTVAPGTPGLTVSAFDRRDIVGRWVGQWQVLSCSGENCAPWIRFPVDFSFTVREDGAGLTALLHLDRNISRDVVELSGVRRADKTVVFTGSSQSRVTSLVQDIDAFEVRLDPNTGLAGELRMRRHAQVGLTTFIGRILSAQREKSALNRTFHGKWAGNVIITEVLACGPSCNVSVGRDQLIRLILDQSADTVSGQVSIHTSVPVSGRFDGFSTLLNGAIPRLQPCPNPGHSSDRTCASEIKGLSISLDLFGRLIGTVEYLHDYWYGGSTSVATHYTYTVRGELVDVVRQ